MTVPAAGEFDVRSDGTGIYLFCPDCGDLVNIDLDWPSIRDLIAAASAHAATHARAEINA